MRERSHIERRKGKVRTSEMEGKRGKAREVVKEGERRVPAS